MKIGEVIDQMNAGDIAEGIGEFGHLGKRKVEIIKTKDRGVRFHHENGTEGKAVRISNTLLDLKWRILPKYVTFEEAMKALKDGKMVALYTIHGDVVDRFYKKDFVPSNWQFKSLFEGKWQIIE